MTPSIPGRSNRNPARVDNQVKIPKGSCFFFGHDSKNRVRKVLDFGQGWLQFKYKPSSARAIPSWGLL